MKNDYYRIEDFIEDPSFVAWVHQSDVSAVRYWEDWHERNPDQRETLVAAIAIVKGIRFTPQYVSREKVQSELAHLNARIDATAPLRSTPGSATSSLFTRRVALNMVAGLGLLFVLGIAVLQITRSPMIVHHTGFGERTEVNLSDGSHITINANSTLRYRENTPRKVWLEGEAFFRVAKIAGTGEKFQVITDDLTVHVYGTEFNVNSRKQQTQVLLEEGKIKLALQNGAEKEMEPGDLITYSAKKNEVLEEKRLARAETITSWKDGTLIFDDITVRDAMAKIAELYGLEIEFKDAGIADKIIHLAVPTQNLEICLKALERSGGMQIRRENLRLTIEESLL
jgi:ferric-dicitrate binding protein FerR (iron transport regulator)